MKQLQIAKWVCICISIILAAYFNLWLVFLMVFLMLYANNLDIRIRQAKEYYDALNKQKEIDLINHKRQQER